MKEPPVSGIWNKIRMKEPPVSGIQNKIRIKESPVGSSDLKPFQEATFMKEPAKNERMVLWGNELENHACMSEPGI